MDDDVKMQRARILEQRPRPTHFMPSFEDRVAQPWASFLDSVGKVDPFAHQYRRLNDERGY